MSKVKETVLKIINDNGFADGLIYLYERWQDEKEYEDFEDYKKAILNNVNKFNNCKGVKVTKRPFGVVVNIEEVKIHIYLKVKSTTVSVCAKNYK